MTPNPLASSTHEWAEPEKAQTRCVRCGAYRQLSSGMAECGAPAAPRKGMRTPYSRPPLVELRLVLEGMKATMLNHVMADDQGWADEIDQAVERALGNFNIDAQVQAIVLPILEQTLRSRVQEAVRSAADAAMATLRHTVESHVAHVAVRASDAVRELFDRIHRERQENDT